MATGWLGAIPPPLGVEPNIVDPPSQLHGNIALHTVCLTLATVAVAVRLYTRTFITKASPGLDDGLCLLSWALSVTFSGLMITSYHWGIGRHMWDTPAIWIPTAFRYFTIAQYIFQCLSCTVKLTFLVLFHRIFWAQTKVRYVIYFGMVFVLCINIGLLFATIFACTPVAKAWNAMLPGHCFDPRILPWISGSLNLATDLFVLILPLGPLWRLNMMRQRKVRLIAVFSLGSFACIASLVRLAETPILYSSLDATWNISRIGVWAVLEANVGIICASSSLLPAFLDKYVPEKIKSSIAQMWSYTLSRTRSNDGNSKDSSQHNQEPKLNTYVESGYPDNDQSTTGTNGSSRNGRHGDPTRFV